MCSFGNRFEDIRDEREENECPFVSCRPRREEVEEENERERERECCVIRRRNFTCVCFRNRRSWN